MPSAASALKVLILSDSPYFYPPFTAGGSVGQLRGLAHEFRQLGMSVGIVARRSAIDRAGTTVHDGDISIRYLGPGGEQRGKGWRDSERHQRWRQNSIRCGGRRLAVQGYLAFIGWFDLGRKTRGGAHRGPGRGGGGIGRREPDTLV